jgi:hypothetical protein
LDSSRRRPRRRVSSSRQQPHRRFSFGFGAAWAYRSAQPLAVVFWGQLLSGVLIALVPALWALSALSYDGLVLVVGAIGAIVGAFAAPTVPKLVAKDRVATEYGRFSASRGAAVKRLAPRLRTHSQVSAS